MKLSLSQNSVKYATVTERMSTQREQHCLDYAASEVEKEAIFGAQCTGGWDHMLAIGKKVESEGDKAK